MAAHEPTNLAQSLDGLKPKDKSPSSARILHTRIAQAQTSLGSAGPRLGWLVAATVITATLQRAVDESGAALFLLKGGTMLQYRLPGMSRTTQDIDGLVRGDIDRFVTELDATLGEPWGPLTLVRGEVETIDVPHKLVKPRRFHMTVLLNGVTWRRVQIEVSPDEGHAGTTPEQIASPSLAGFGLPTPDHLVSLSMHYQIAQKIHAATDPPTRPRSSTTAPVTWWTCCCCASSPGRPGIRHRPRSAPLSRTSSPPASSKQRPPTLHRAAGPRD